MRHRFLEVADCIRHDLVGLQSRCRYLAHETPDDPLIVVLYGLICVEHPADRVSVEDALLLFNRRVLERWVVPIRRANVKTLLEVVHGDRVPPWKSRCTSSPPSVASGVADSSTSENRHSYRKTD